MRPRLHRSIEIPHHGMTTPEACVCIRHSCYTFYRECPWGLSRYALGISNTEVAMPSVKPSFPGTVVDVVSQALTVVRSYWHCNRSDVW